MMEGNTLLAWRTPGRQKATLKNYTTVLLETTLLCSVGYTYLNQFRCQRFSSRYRQQSAVVEDKAQVKSAAAK